MTEQGQNNIAFHKRTKTEDSVLKPDKTKRECSIFNRSSRNKDRAKRTETRPQESDPSVGAARGASVVRYSHLIQT